MRDDLDKLLCEKYPKIFANRREPATRTCMSWGFNCGDGWFDLIDVLCERLQYETDKRGAPQTVAVQVKQKFGQLRFYAHPVSETQFALIDFVESLSERVCEECGSPGTLLVTPRRWFETRCAQHASPGSVIKDQFHLMLASRAPSDPPITP